MASDFIKDQKEHSLNLPVINNRQFPTKNQTPIHPLVYRFGYILQRPLHFSAKEFIPLVKYLHGLFEINHLIIQPNYQSLVIIFQNRERVPVPFHDDLHAVFRLIRINTQPI